MPSHYLSIDTNVNIASKKIEKSTAFNIGYYNNIIISAVIKQQVDSDQEVYVNILMGHFSLECGGREVRCKYIAILRVDVLSSS